MSDSDGRVASGARPTEQLLAFVCAGHRWAVGVSQVREVVEPRALTRVPDAPPWALGVMNLRGRAIPVIDLSHRLALAETRVDDGVKRPYVLVTEITDSDGRDQRLGLQVDDIDDVWTLGEAGMEEPPSFGIPVHPDYLRGVTAFRGEPALVLHLDRVLTADELLEALEAGDA